MNRLFLAGVLLTLVSFRSQSQQGYFFHSQFSPVEDHRDQFHYAIEQDTNGHLFVSNRMGLMVFDGMVWDVIPTPGPIFTMKSHNASIYLGGPAGFGKLVLDVYGNLQFQSLSDTIPEAAGVVQLVARDSSLLMTNGYSVLEYFPATNRWNVAAFDTRVYSIVPLWNQLVVHTEDGFYTPDGEKLQDKPLNASTFWLFSEESPAGQLRLIGNSANELFLLTRSGVQPFPVEDDGYIKESVLIGASWIDPNLIAIGTLKGGVVFVNAKSGKIDQIINYHTGLPDNEVQVLFCDKSRALWIGNTHGYTRIAPGIPFKSYNYYPGLEGSIYTSGLLGKEVYVGTNLGAYYLDVVRDYEEVTYFVKKNPNARPEREPGTSILGGLFRKKTSKTETSSAEPTEKKRSGLFSNRKRDVEQVAKAPQPVTTTVAPTNTRKFKKEVRKELQSITYLYKKIPGIDGRVSQLMELDKSRMIASGLDGIFIIENHKSARLLQEAVRHTFLSENKKLLLTSTYSGRLISMVQSAGKWQVIPLIEDLDEEVEYIFEDREGTVWLCMSDKLLWIKTEGHKIQSSGEYAFPNTFRDPVLGVADDSLGIVLLHARGFFKLEGDSLLAFTLFGMEKPVKYLASKKRVLVFNGRGWTILGKKVEAPFTLPYLNVFDNLASLDVRPDGTLWVVTADDRFYRIDKTQTPLDSYNPLLRQIRTVNNQLLPIGESLEVDQLESFITFHFNLPEYSGIMKVDYRYRLVGLHDSWSEWSPNYNTIEFAYLPPGSYQLEVEARTIFGTQKQLEPVYFRIMPPYWKRPWFYALEFLFFGCLLFFSARLSKTKHLKWQVLNRALAFITVIMVIEFLQTGVQSVFDTSSTPVIDFFVQVAIALSLLPVEGLMRNRFFQEESKELAGIVSGVSKIKESIKKRGNEGVA